MEQETKQACMSCGESLHGRFCHHCGEKVLESKERTVVHFFGQVINEVTSLESRLWSTVKAIFVQPGLLSSHYAMGKRNPYMKPIALFFLCNLIYFLFPVLDTFNTILQYQYSMPYSNLINVRERVENAIEASGMTQEVFQLTYNQATEANSKLLLIFLVPLTMPIFALIGWRSRQNMSDHLIFALEYNIFILLFTSMLLGYVMFAIQALLKALDLPALNFTDFNVTSMAAMLASYFLYQGIRRFYRYNWYTSSLLAVMALLCSYISLTIYRWVLFEVTIRSV